MTPEELNRRALSLLRKESERDELVIIHAAQVTDPASGDILYTFRAAATDAPDAPSWQIALAADGSPRSPLPAPRTVRYSVKFVCGAQDEACGCCTPVRHGRYATQISIHNYSQQPVTIRKRFIPVVLAGAPLGREPKIATSRAEDSIALPPHTATMDDCCRLTELLFGAPVDALTIGVLEIIATRDVSVTAVYTTAGAIDVVQLTGQPA